MLRVHRFSPGLLNNLCSLVNAHLDMLPVRWTCQARELSASLWGNRWPHTEFWTQVADLHVACAIDDGHLLGAAQYCRMTRPVDMDTAPGSGLLNWFYFDPEHPEAGDELIAHVRRVLLNSGCNRLVAFHQCAGMPFVYFTRGNLSSRWSHIDAALRRAAFEVLQRSEHVLMTAKLPPVASPPEPDVPIKTVWRDRPDSEVQALDSNGRPTGFCAVWDMARTSASPEAARWSFVAYIEVMPGFRRRGIGAHLLSLQMQRAARDGKHAMALAVSEQNHPAIELYQRMGFESVDRMWSYEAVLSA